MASKGKRKGRESGYGQRDVARDDDFLSDTLLADLVPVSRLRVHHAWGHGRHTYDESVLSAILRIIRESVVTQNSKSPPSERVKEGVRRFMGLDIVKRHLRGKEDRERFPFLTHANRYLQIYLPSSHFEFLPTNRYSHHTKKNELAVVATAPLEVGKPVSGLCGVLVALTKEENEELRGGQDFSIVVNAHTKRFYILLGPARFVNHDCNPNVEMHRDGKTLTFEIIRPIALGEEILSSYGENYFGEDNRECLCASCEKNGAGMWGKQEDDSDEELGASAGLSRHASADAGPPEEEFELEERRTRRGTVFWRKPPTPSDDEDEEDEDEDGDDEADEAEDQADEVGRHPSSSREVSVSLVDHLIAGKAATSDFALVPPESIPAVLDAPSLPVEPSPEPTPSDLPDCLPDPTPDVKAEYLAPPLLSLLPSPPLTSPVDTPSGANDLTSQPSLDDNIPLRPTSPALSDRSSGLSEPPSDFDMEATIRSLMTSSPISGPRMTAASRMEPMTPIPSDAFDSDSDGIGEQCAAPLCRKLFDLNVNPKSKYCDRCARHFAIFRIPWPDRTGERLPSPKVVGPTIWSRGRPVLATPPSSRESSAGPQQKRKGKEESVDSSTRASKRARLGANSSSSRAPRRKGKEVAARRSNSSRRNTQESDSSEEDDSDSDDSDESSEEESEIEAIPSRARRGRSRSGPTPVKRQSASHKATPAKVSQHGRILRPTPKTQPQRSPSPAPKTKTPSSRGKVSAVKSASSLGREESASARALRAANRHRDSESPSSRSESPSHAMSTRSSTRKSSLSKVLATSTGGRAMGAGSEKKLPLGRPRKLSGKKEDDKAKPDDDSDSDEIVILSPPIRPKAHPVRGDDDDSSDDLGNNFILQSPKRPHFAYDRRPPPRPVLGGLIPRPLGYNPVRPPLSPTNPAYPRSSPNKQWGESTGSSVSPQANQWRWAPPLGPAPLGPSIILSLPRPPQLAVRGWVPPPPPKELDEPTGPPKLNRPEVLPRSTIHSLLRNLQEESEAGPSMRRDVFGPVENKASTSTTAKRARQLTESESDGISLASTDHRGRQPKIQRMPGGSSFATPQRRTTPHLSRTGPPRERKNADERLTKSVPPKPPRLSADQFLVLQAQIAEEGVRTRSARRAENGRRSTRASMGRRHMSR